MKQIRILYFHGAKLPNLPYDHQELHPFTKDKREEIIDTVMDAGYNVLLQSIKDFVIIWIDKYRFQQR